MSTLASPSLEPLGLIVTEIRFLDWRNTEARAELKARMNTAAVSLGLDLSQDADIAAFDEAMRVRAVALARMPYRDYLLTEHWQTVRRGALSRAHYACQLCSSSGPLHVHHRTYEFRGDEGPEDVTVLCAPCHQTFHDHRELAR